jgi:hypothetical protein
VSCASTQAARHQDEHLALPWRQLPELRRGRLERVGAGGEVLDQPAGDRGREEGVAAMNDADRLEQPLAGGVLEQEPRGAGAERTEDVLVEVERGQHEHSRPWLDIGAG